MRPDDVAEEKIKNRRRRAAHVLLLVLLVLVVYVSKERERESSLSLSLSLSLSFVTSFKAKERRPRSQSDFLSKFPLFFFTPFFRVSFAFFFLLLVKEERQKTRVTPLTWNQPRWLALERDDSREDDDDEEEEEEETKKRDAIGVVFLSPSVAGKKRGSRERERE